MIRPAVRGMGLPYSTVGRGSRLTTAVLGTWSVMSVSSAMSAAMSSVMSCCVYENTEKLLLLDKQQTPELGAFAASDQTSEASGQKIPLSTRGDQAIGSSDRSRIAL